MRKVALLLVESALLLVALELGIRAVRPELDVPHLRVHAAGYYTWYPGSRFTYRNLPKVEPRSAAVRINAAGMRGADVVTPKPADERRVLVIGDSYTAGVQLPEDQIFTTLLQTDLNAARPGITHHVLNAGVNGAGTGHELLYFEHEGAALAPDVVVLQYTWNDLGDTRAQAAFRLTDDGVELRDDLRRPASWREPVLAVRDAIANRSLVAYLFYRALTGGVPRAGAAETRPSGADPDVTLVVRLIATLVAASNARGAPVIVLTLPGPIYVAGGDAAYDQVVAGVRALVATGPNQLIVADPLLRAALARGEAPYLANDGHLSAAGHRVVADALAPAILRYEE